ncbi:LysR family transcriptional regulator [Sporosarcina pasteurii]|uniref:Cyn operon transcriptional activator n=1 Tax=Sporosarcina pasteurii TaxID=1474 RepID=A0A380CKZ0_SPOPA|nr:LysR family transcriptional regulator [Sporosarcina pasteurii]MDS9471878.1 LysR family transcriptional regulator [Sporosarcina pasteurii]QBQ06615.1 LysR family transcriptional regulator [Sporosarcina pasteurii]SUJ21986.1 Cyn operon transcriptional activator [Sporosarcina pasteurii]
MVSKLDLYKIFCQVGVSKSFSQAAKALYMTQPAVSQAIMQLERELDIRLFHRTPKGAFLTQEGEFLFEYASSALNLLQVGQDKMNEFKNLTAGELKIGVGDTISRYFLLPYLELFHNRYPNVKVKIENGTTSELCAILKAGEVDIAVCNFPLEDPSLTLKPFIDVHDIFVCGDKYQHILSNPISYEELMKYPLIFLEPKSNSRQYVEKYILSKGLQIEPEFELGSHDLLLEFAKINLGIACVTKEFSQDYLSKGLVSEVKITDAIPKREVGVCYLKSVPLSLAATRFVEMVENDNS